MLNAELQTEEEAARTEEAKKREAAKAKEETPKEGDGSPRAAEEKPDAGGEAAGRELDALRVRAAELDDRLRAKGLRKAERAKISEELSGVRARMHELSGGNLVLFSRGEAAAGRPALSPTKAALRDRLLLKIAQTAGIRIVRERSAQILGSARNAEVRRRLGGYMGKAWSARANDALERGLRPAPMIADELGVSSEAVEAYMRSPEWHHVGEDFEEVRFFDPDEAPLTDAKDVRDAETAQSFLTYVDMFNYDTRTFTVKPRVAGRFESEASDEAYALFTNRSTAVAKDAFAAADKLRALIEGGTATAEELRVAAEEAAAAAKSGRKASDAAAKAFLSEHKDWRRVRPRRARRRANGLRYSLEEAFPATEAERAEIERAAKATGTWLKAPNGQDTKLTPKQWVTVRTAAFKKWFGDWEKSATLAKSFREEDSNANIIRVERDGYTDEFRRIQAESNRLSQEDVAQFHRSSKQLTEDERLALGRVYERLLAGSGNARNDVWTDLTGKGNTFRIARVNGELFHDIFEVNRKYLPNGELVDLHDDYSNAKCFLTDDGMCGFAVEEGGNLVSVFSLNPNKIPERTGFLYAIRDFAREQGATHLDAYASNKQNLEAIYAKTLGFHVAAEMDYAMEYDHDDIAANHGKPKVVFMVDSEVVERRKFDDYDAAVAYQRGATSAANAASASKVVDENGEPLVVYHGTDADFTVFDRAKTRATMDIQGNFFSPWEDDARGYGSNVRRFFLNLRNPADENTGYHSLHEFEGQNGAGVKARERLVALGYDGVNNGGEEFIAFSPEQIKSATENVGTFDAGNPDIRYSISMAEQAAWDEVLDAYEAGRLSSRNSHTVLNRTPVVLARILSDDGKNPNLKIVIDRSILDKTTGKTPSKFTGEYHHISVKDLRGLLVNLDNPIAVFDSETIPGDKVVLTEIKDFETGENAVVALAIGTKRGYIAVNAVSSIHGRRASSLNKWLKDGKLRYCNTQKFPAAVGVRWGGYPQRAVSGGKSPQRSVSVGVQNPQAAAPSGNASLLTEDDFKDELGVVKVNEENRFSLSMMDDEAAEKVARERRRGDARKKSAKTAARTGSRWRQGQAGDVDFSLSKFLVQN